MGRTAAELHDGDIKALLSGEISYLRVARYLDPAWCAEISHRFLDGPADNCDYGVTKCRLLGLPLAPMLDRKEAYFSKAPALAKTLRAAYRGGVDPSLKLRGDLERCTGWNSIDAVEDGRPYVFDMIGEVLSGSSIPLHCHSAGEMPGMAVSRFPRLLSWNVYLSVADRGGALRIYRRRRHEGDDDFEKARQGYDKKLVAGAEHSEVSPEIGDLIVFDSDNYHEVLETDGAHRISAHSFISMDPARGEFSFWC